MDKLAPVDIMLPPIENEANLPIDAGMWLMALLVSQRRAKREDTGEIIDSAEALAAAMQTIVGFGGPLLATQDGGYTTAPNVCESMRTSARSTGLPTRGFHTFRRDLAKQSSLCYSPEHARVFLNHGMRKDITNRGYVGVRNFDLVGMRSGERLDKKAKDALKKAGYYYRSLNGAVSAAAAQYFSSNDVATGDDASPFFADAGAKATTRKKRAPKGSSGTFEEKLEKALVDYPGVEEASRRTTPASTAPSRWCPRVSSTVNASLNLCRSQARRCWVASRPSWASTRLLERL